MAPRSSRTCSNDIFKISNLFLDSQVGLAEGFRTTLMADHTVHEAEDMLNLLETRQKFK